MSQIGTLLNHTVPVGLGLYALYSPYNASRVMATFMTLRGTMGVVNPIELGKQFGIPWANEQNTLFIPALGARSAAAGILALVLSFREQREALALQFGCMMLIGAGDIYTLLRQPGSRNVSAHALGTAALGAMSYCLFHI